MDGGDVMSKYDVIICRSVVGNGTFSVTTQLFSEKEEKKLMCTVKY